MEKIILLAVLAMAMVSGCAPQQPPISPLGADLAVQTVCIEKNQTVQFEDFLPAVEDGFARHGIASKVYLDPGDMPKDCDYTAKYTAERGWDLVFYLKTASVTVYQDKKKVAGLGYVLDGAFSKFGSAKSKIDPRMDEMLKDYPLKK